MNKPSSTFFFYLSNALSISRAPLAFLFLNPSPSVRTFAVILAMITDSIDGFLARKANSTSRFGAIVDPLMDKFFVYFILSILFIENKISVLEWIAFTSRDFALFIFGGFLLLRSCLSGYEVKSIILGKISTALQFLFLILLSWNIPVPAVAYLLFVPLAMSALVELFFNYKKTYKLK